MRPPETFETHRLTLRPARLEDAGSIFESYARDPEVTRFLTWTPHESVGCTESFLRRCLEAWEEETAFPWAVTLSASDELVGMIEARIDPPRMELGYVIAQEFWDQGIATEAVRAVTNWALDQSEIWRVWAFVDVENLASAAVLEKAGMVREGLLHRWVVHPGLGPEPRDCYAYAIWR